MSSSCRTRARACLTAELRHNKSIGRFPDGLPLTMRTKTGYDNIDISIMSSNGDNVNTRLQMIGERLRLAREAMGYTQEDVARALKISRPRYSDIENGKRDIGLREMEEFASLFGRPAEHFFSRSVATGQQAFQVLFRKTAEYTGAGKVVAKFETLCAKMHALDALFPHRSSTADVPSYSFEKRKLGYWAAACAGKERRRLDLGMSPIKDMEELLEEKCGMKIFYLQIPAESGISGMFTYDERLGGCILLNSSNRPSRRQFSLAHEYGHFLFHRHKVGMVSREQEKETADEKIADYFASNFLMPRESVEELFQQRVAGKNATSGDVVYFAEHFGVSFQAMLYRLNNLRLFSDETKDRLLKTSRVEALCRAMGMEPEREGSRSHFPRLYRHLCLKAYHLGRITTAKLADFLEIPLCEAMEIAAGIRERGPA